MPTDRSVYGVTVLPGEGIGPEVIAAAIRVLEASNVPFVWDIQENLGTKKGTIRKKVIQSIQKNKVALKGPTATPVGSGRRSLNVMLREEFDLYVNVRPVWTLPNVVTPYSDREIHLTVYRQNTEGLYVAREQMVREGVVEVTGVFTDKEARRLAHFAFRHAEKNGVPNMTIGHKANIFKMGHGRFKRIVNKVAKGYSITCNSLIVDNLALQLVRNPSWFGGLILPNLEGDIFSDLCAGIVHGSLGFAGGANIGDEYAIFEAVHGTAPDIAGTGMANPAAAILSGAMLLDHIGELEEARRVRSAVRTAANHSRLTRDVKKEFYVSTNEFVETVIGAMRVETKNVRTTRFS